MMNNSIPWSPQVSFPYLPPVPGQFPQGINPTSQWWQQRPFIINTSTNFSTVNCNVPIEQDNQSALPLPNSSRPFNDGEPSFTPEPTTKRPRIEQYGPMEWQTERHNAESRINEHVDALSSKDQQITKLKKELESTLTTLSSRDSQINDLVASFCQVRAQLSTEQNTNKRTISGMMKKQNQLERELTRLNAENLELKTNPSFKPTETIGDHFKGIHFLKKSKLDVTKEAGQISEDLSERKRSRHEETKRWIEEREPYLVAIRKKQEKVKLMEKKEVKYKEKITKLTKENDIMNPSSLHDLLTLVKSLRENSCGLSKCVSELNEKLRCELDQIRQKVEENFGFLQQKLCKQTKLIENQKYQLKKSEAQIMELSERTKSLSSATSPMLAKMRYLRKKTCELDITNKELTESKLSLEQQMNQQQNQHSDVQLENSNAIMKQRMSLLLTSLQLKDEQLVEKQNELSELQTCLYALRSKPENLQQ